ncbi:hypothetical protein POM88_026928 [Heracleum sosnowskyi]|uniref:Uncharacterized protein n=1 Tax=Heracleum sosnowskyi TaxID=360622 RepID=A0AAD8I6S7_9APIA|nr:hypothetical protein POM88_026928 [Heracleum sosnowskyi]
MMITDLKVLTTDPSYSLCRYLCECALDWYYTKKYDLYEEVNVVSVFRTNLDAEKTQTHNLHIVFKAYLPDDKTTQTFRTTILYRIHRSIQIVIAYVGPDRLTQENFFDFPIDHLSDSDDDEDYGSDCEVSQLNPAFLKPIFKEKSPEKSPEEGPAYRPCSQLKYRRRRTGLYQPGTELSEEVERFKTDVANSGGFELALCFYNMKEDTKFGNVKVLRAMTYVCGSLAYNITFEASLSDKDVKIFQTNGFLQKYVYLAWEIAC